MSAGLPTPGSFRVCPSPRCPWGPWTTTPICCAAASTGELLLIDAANDADTLLGLIGDTPLARIVTTHQHFDHWQALQAVQQATGAKSTAHPEDAGPLPVTPTDLVRHGDTVSVGDCELSVIHLRGHTPGSIALCYDAGGEQPHLFTGDSLFPGGPGNTEHDPERFGQLIGDLEDRVFGQLPDGTWVYPGHGKDTTLGAERPHVPEWRARGW